MRIVLHDNGGTDRMSRWRGCLSILTLGFAALFWASLDSDCAHAEAVKVFGRPVALVKEAETAELPTTHVTAPGDLSVRPATGQR